MFNNLQFFKKLEFSKDVDKLNGLVLILLDNLREQLNENNSIVIHSDYRQSTTSQHGLGNAIDFHITNISLLESSKLILDYLKYMQVDDRCGLGIYPCWNNPGFHLDVRGVKARWSQDKTGKYLAYHEWSKL